MPPSPNLLSRSRLPFFLAGLLSLAAPWAALGQTDIVISQYYEGASNNKFLELYNPTTNSISLQGYTVTIWSNSNREAWKGGTFALNSSASLALDNVTLDAGQYYLISHSSAAAPTYALQATNKTWSGLAFNGDDSVALFKQTPAAAPATTVYALANLVDAVSLVANTAAEKSLSRLLFNTMGSLTTTGAASQDLTTVWEVVPTVSTVVPVVNDTTNQVATAAEDAGLRLRGQVNGAPPVLTSFSIANGMSVTPSPKVTLNFSSTGDNPTHYAVSTDPAFPNLSWQPYSGSIKYTLEGGPGLKNLYFKLKNSNILVPPSTTNESDLMQDTIEYTPSTTTPTLLFTQYYEGLSNNKYVEITNYGNETVDISGWRMVVWTNLDADLWAYSGLGSSQANSSVTLGTVQQIGPRQSIVLGNSAAVLGGVTNVTTASLSHNGNDSIALYSGTPGTATLVDVLSFTNIGNEGADKSFTRATTAPGYDFATAAAMNTFPTVWSELTLATVAAATATSDANHLGTYFTDIAGYTYWTNLNFAGVSDPLVTGFSADPDKDGVPNGLEYQLGSDPKAASGVFSALTYNPGTLAVRHDKAKNTGDVQMVYQWSTDLQEWQPSATPNAGGVLVSIASQTAVDNGSKTEEDVVANVLAGTPAKLFLRIKATKP